MSTLEEHVTLSDEQRSVCQSLETDAPVFFHWKRRNREIGFAAFFIEHTKKNVLVPAPGRIPAIHGGGLIRSCCCFLRRQYGTLYFNGAPAYGE